jgi:hypothetical protein
MSDHLPGNARQMTCGNVRFGPSSIKQNVDGWTRIFEVSPGYDCINDYPSCWNTMGGGRHGRHGMDFKFLLGAEEGVVNFTFFASDLLPGSLHYGSTRDGVAKLGVMAADLGHHWTRPTWEGEERHGPCDYLHGADCYYDGSGLNAADVLDRFLREGMDAVWQELEAYHSLCSEGARKASDSDEPGGAA